MTIWKTIPSYGGHYEASDTGIIRAKKRIVKKRTRWGGVMNQVYKERILYPAADRDGYLRVSVSGGGEVAHIGVHRLVAMAFHGMPEDGLQCCHNDGDKTNNRPDNLRWDTQYNNNQDRKRHGNYAKGVDHPMSKFSAELVAAIEAGNVSLKEAARRGVSKTHYYRLRRRGVDA